MGEPRSALDVGVGDGGVHPQRKEIARYLLSRGLDAQTLAPSTTQLDLAAAPPADQAAAPGAAPLADPADEPAADAAGAAAAAGPAAGRIVFPDGLTPQMVELDPVPGRDDPLPLADAVVITWTVDELAGLAKVFTPGHSASRWAQYAHEFDTKYAHHIRPHAPAANSHRLGSYQLVTLAGLRVLLMKSELHLNQDGISTGVGTATLPIKDLFHQIIYETRPDHVFTIGTSGSVFDAFGLGDVVVTRAAKFRLQQEFRNEAFNGQSYHSDWQIPLDYFDTAQALMAGCADQLAVPPFAPPTTAFPFPGGPISAPDVAPAIRIEQGGRDMPEFHPILTTDYFEYGTSTNRLDLEGAAVEMGDAALGLACSELQRPPRWAVIRNMSDPVINGALPAKQFKLNEQTTWAVGYYTAYGEWTSVMGALTTWAILAGIANP